MKKIREKIKEEKFRNDAIRATVDVGKNIIEVSDGKCLRLCVHLEKMPGHTSPRMNPRMGTRGNRKEGRARDGLSKTEYD